MKRIYALYYLIFAALFSSCKQENTTVATDIETNTVKSSRTVTVKYATGFSVESTELGYQVTVKNPWPEAQKDYTYILTSDPENHASKNEGTLIKIPIQRIVPTSTTHIPPIVLLAAEEKLVGFPSTDYISNEKVRSLIDAGDIVDLGTDQNMDLEATLYTQPDLVIGYGITDENAWYGKLQDAGIPVLYNGDWTEEHPLGKAEWIKLYGVLLGKSQESIAIFNQIERDYLETLALVKEAPKPKVIAGATWKDVWYLPYGNSWQGKILNDAAANYVYADTEGKGSLSYNIERVLTDARDAEYWIAPAQYTSYSKMKNDQKAYTLFDSFKNKKVYTFALNKGEKGGVTYYEEASMRPDLVLKDLVKILHPELELGHELYFFAPLEE